MIHALIDNALLLLLLCWLLALCKNRWSLEHHHARLLAGLWFGGVCVAGMSLPLELAPGVIFDARSVVLSMAALFGGVLVGGVAALIAAAYRLWLGGAGIYAGLASILLPLLFGLAYRRLHRRGLVGLGFAPLLIFGLLLHIAIITLQLLLPRHLALQSLQQVAMPLLGVFSLLTALLGLMLQDMRLRANTLRALRQNEAHLRAVTQSIPDLLVVMSADGRLLQLGPGDTGLEPAQLEGRPLQELFGSREAARIADYLKLALQSRQPERVRYRLHLPAGERLYEGRAQRLEQDPDGLPAVLWLGRDITERNQLELERRIAAIAFESQQGMFVTDAQTRILRVNQAFSEITGYAPEAVIGQKASMLGSERQDADFYRQMWCSIRDQGAWQGEIWNRRANGEIFPEWLSITAVRDELGEISHYVATLTDITERRAAEERIRALAFYDTLTGLPNRRLLLERLQQATLKAARQQHFSALMFIDLDGFKSINDLHGHSVGDDLLKAAAQRLQEQVRSSDTVARLGGDEFMVMLENLGANAEAAASQAEHLGQKILAVLDAPYALANQLLHSSASIGIVLFGNTEVAVETLIQQADMSMYEAKNAGKNALRFFDAHMQRLVSEQLRLEQELFSGIEHHEFLLHVQPQVDEDLGLVGGEILLRWQHPQRGLLEPAQFLDSARRARLMQRLDLQVLEQACACLAAWREQPALAALSLSVNLSAASLHREGFVESLAALLEQHQTPAERLCLELTETLLFDDVATTSARMDALRARGVRFSIDDFGTGYSSIAYLQQLPLEQLKLDQSFVSQLDHSASSRAITRTISALADSLQLQLIAEGVETREQHTQLLASGCRRFQGHLFGRPMPLQAFEQYCRDQPVIAAH